MHPGHAASPFLLPRSLCIARPAIPTLPLCAPEKHRGKLQAHHLRTYQRSGKRFTRCTTTSSKNPASLPYTSGEFDGDSPKGASFVQLETIKSLANPYLVHFHSPRYGDVSWAFDTHKCLSFFIVEIAGRRCRIQALYVDGQDWQIYGRDVGLFQAMPRQMGEESGIVSYGSWNLHSIQYNIKYARIRFYVSVQQCGYRCSCLQFFCPKLDYNLCTNASTPNRSSRSYLRQAKSTRVVNLKSLFIHILGSYPSVFISLFFSPTVRGLDME